LVALKSRSNTQAHTRKILKLLIAKNRTAVLACLESVFDKFATASLVYVVAILLEAGKRRPVLKYWKNNLESPIFGDLIAVQTCPVENVQNLVEIIDHPATPHEARDKAWKLVELNDIPADEILGWDMRL
jgi:hypothetical protein